MTEEHLLLLVGDAEELMDELAKERPAIALQTISEQYDPSKHAITKRLDNPIKTDARPSTAPVLKLEGLCKKR